MTPDELAAIVARDAQSIVWAPGTLASDPAVNDKLWQAVQDRRALLALLRETREALARFSWGPDGVGTCSWCRWIRGSDLTEGHAADCPMRDALAALGEP